MTFRNVRQSAASKAHTYGPAHRAERQRRLASYAPSDPCVLCGGPLGAVVSRIHLDHDPATGLYRGLAHASCNMRDGARRGARRRHDRRAPRHFLDW